MKKTETKERISGNALKTLMKTVDHFFPNFLEEMKKLEDPRKKKPEYPLPFLIFTQIMNFLTHGEAQRRVEHMFDTPSAFHHLHQILGGKKIEKMCDAEIFTDTFKEMNVTEIENFRYKLLNRLIRNKTLDQFRIKGCFNVDVDATRFQRSNHQVSEEWLHQTKDGKTAWYVGSPRCKTTSCRNGYINVYRIHQEWRWIRKTRLRTKCIQTTHRKVKEIFSKTQDQIGNGRVICV